MDLQQITVAMDDPNNATEKSVIYTFRHPLKLYPSPVTGLCLLALAGSALRHRR